MYAGLQALWENGWLWPDSCFFFMLVGVASTIISVASVFILRLISNEAKEMKVLVPALPEQSEIGVIRFMPPPSHGTTVR